MTFLNDLRLHVPRKLFKQKKRFRTQPRVFSVIRLIVVLSPATSGADQCQRTDLSTPLKDRGRGGGGAARAEALPLLCIFFFFFRMEGILT